MPLPLTLVKYEVNLLSHYYRFNEVRLLPLDSGSCRTLSTSRYIPSNVERINLLTEFIDHS